jgi:hypothetical protein
MPEIREALLLKLIGQAQSLVDADRRAKSAENVVEVKTVKEQEASMCRTMLLLCLKLDAG